jgi:hypothetical protein
MHRWKTLFAVLGAVVMTAAPVLAVQSSPAAVANVCPPVPNAFYVLCALFPGHAHIAAGTVVDLFRAGKVVAHAGTVVDERRFDHRQDVRLELTARAAPVYSNAQLLACRKRRDVRLIRGTPSAGYLVSGGVIPENQTSVSC